MLRIDDAALALDVDMAIAVRATLALHERLTDVLSDEKGGFFGAVVLLLSEQS